MCDNHGNYLGVPSLVGRNRSDAFNFVKEKTRKRLQGWRGKLLSRARKEILLKAVVQAVPSCIMSVFLLPVLLCEELERMMNSFWWGSGSNHTGGIRWKRWDKLCLKKSDGGLGFRKVRNFNIAMLAKQVWRLIEHPSLLVSRVLKAQYYPGSNFFGATVGSNPNYTWRSIFATKQLILEGARVKIGSRNSVSIWQSHWIPNSVNPFIESPPVHGYEHASVAVLINPLTHKWHGHVINYLFNERDRSRILSIPLPINSVHDQVYWAWDARGNYTVKSGYRYLMSDAAILSRPSVINWQTVWSLSVPSKVSNFIWRSISNCLPTMSALRVKQVVEEGTCPLCNLAAETEYHALVLCQYARQVWNVSRFDDRWGTSCSLSNWWSHACSVNAKSDMEEMAVLCWSIWNNRNYLVWHVKLNSPNQVVKHASTMLNQWRAAQVQVWPVVPPPSTAQHSWSRPPLGWLKCNTDASVFTESNCCGYGSVLQNSEGVFMACVNGAYPGIFSPNLAEAISLREALSWLKRRGFSRVIVESDSMTVVNAMFNNLVDYSMFGLVINDCKSLSRDIGFCLFRFVGRSVNSVAHTLARASNSLSGSVESVLAPPSLISDVLCFDLI